MVTPITRNFFSPVMRLRTPCPQSQPQALWLLLVSHRFLLCFGSSRAQLRTGPTRRANHSSSVVAYRVSYLWSLQGPFPYRLRDSESRADSELSLYRSVLRPLLWKEQRRPCDRSVGALIPACRH